MIQSPYSYAPIDRTSEDGLRLYSTPDGHRVPSVTSILEATKSAEDKAGLQAWRDAIGEKRAAEITTEAASRGTRMHSFLEHYVKGIPKEPGTNPYSKQGHQMAQQVISQGLSKMTEFWGSEVALYHPGLYAGTTDLVGVHENQPAIVDFKQSNKLKTDERVEGYKIQLVAYALAHNAVYGTQIQRGVIMMCTADYAYQEWIVEGSEFNHYVDRWWHAVETFYLVNT